VKILEKIALATVSMLALALTGANAAEGPGQSIQPGLYEMPYYGYQFCLDSGLNWYSIEQPSWNGYWATPVQYLPGHHEEPAAMVGSTDPGVENDSITITGTPGHYHARWNEWNSDFSWIGLVVVKWTYVSSSCSDAKKSRSDKARLFPMQLRDTPTRPAN
jgi:hypothetical protein